MVYGGWTGSPADHCLGRSDRADLGCGRSLSTRAMAAILVWGRRDKVARWVGGWLDDHVRKAIRLPWKFSLEMLVRREPDHDLQMVDVSSDCSNIG